ncbi:hypothetical protein KKA14_18665, partial [bacterium]|nr:hypothetical protein [bacterium]
MISEQSRYSVLFLSDSFINLHLIAEKIAKTSSIDYIAFQSASLTPKNINPIVRHVLSEAGLNGCRLENITIIDLKPCVFDLIITVGNPN